jgi:hypothetical protein
VSAGLAGGDRDDFELFVGGKSRVADPVAQHPEARRAPARDTVFAKASRCCGYNQIHWRPANWMAAPGLPTAESAGCEKPRLAEWNERVSTLPAVFAHQHPKQSAEQRGAA